MRTIRTAFIFLVLTIPVYAQELPVIGILPFEAVKVSEADVAAVDSFIQQGFLTTGVYQVIEAAQRDQILGGPDAAACTDNPCAVEIGRKLAADQVVLGTVALAEGRFIINAKILATANGRTLAADSISAARVEDLESACETLAIGMIKRAMPGKIVEPVEDSPAEGSLAEASPSGGEGSAAGSEAKSGGSESGDGRENGQTQTAAEKRIASPEKRNRADLWALVDICGGMFLLELGNVMGSTSSELLRRVSETYIDYGETSWNFDALWQTYSSAYRGYVFSNILAYVSWSASVASIPTYLFVFPEQAFRLSRLGSIVFASGAGLSAAGNVLDLMAGAQRYRNDFLYADYMSAGTDHDELFDRYRNGYILYSVERLTSYGLWLLGGAGMITAFFLPGEKMEPISGFWEKTMLVGGISLIGLGSVTRSVALNYRQNHIDSGGNEDDYQRYVLNSVLSYTLWALGGAGMVLPFVLELGKEKTAVETTKVRPEQLQLLPVANGLILRVNY